MHFFCSTKFRKCRKFTRKAKASNEYFNEVQKLARTIPNWRNLFSQDISRDERLQQWIRLKIIGEPLIEKFAWAVPTEKALDILLSFSPLVELGAGKGYWAR